MSVMRFSLLSRRSLILAATWSVVALSAQDNEKLTYDDQIRPLLENKCFSCHNPDKKKGGLDLTSYASLIAGGGGGAVVDPGNPAGSRLWTCSAKKEEPFMPPEGAPLEAKDQTLLSKWIAGGVLQAKGSVARKANKPKVDLAVAVSTGKPTGPVARPENVLLEPVVVTSRTTAVVAMASSPWTSLLAVAGQKQILLYDTESHDLAGVLPYPEGYAHSLKFSANGSLLIMGGGRAGKFGHAVVWDVKTGHRVTEVGKEFDQIMSADISANHRMVAMGTNAKRVKCFDTTTGEVLYTISKHTEWVTAVGFSPDGVLLASADRNGNVMVWEAENGGEFYNLGQHKGAVTDLAWRSDGNVLASCAADGTVSVWEMKTGKRVAGWSAHGAAVQSVAFTPDGKLLSVGNDGNSALWTIDGKRLEQKQGVHQDDIVSKVVALYDSKTYVTGNWLGEVRFFEVATGRELTRVSSNPPKIEQRILDTEKRLTELEALQKLPGPVAPTPEQLALQKAVAEAHARLAPLQEQIDAVTKERDALRVQRDKAKDEAARTEIRKQMTALKEKIAPVVTASEKDRIFLRQNSTQVAWLTAEITQMQLRITESESSLDYFKKQKAKVQGKELESVEANLVQWTKRIETQRDDVAKTQAHLDVIQKAEALENQRRSATTEIQALRQHLVYLHAAQFNVGVISEHDKLTKLQGDIADLQAAKVENENGKVADAKLIDTTQKVLGTLRDQLPDLTDRVQSQEATLKEIEKTLMPQRLAESVAAGQVETQNQLIKQRETAWNEMNRSREVEIARAKAMAEEYARSTMRPTRLRLTDLGTKSDELNKQIEELKAAEGKAKANVSQALVAVKTSTEANSKSQATLQVAQQSQALAETDLLKAEEAYHQAREWKAWFSTYYFANKEWTTQTLSQAQAKLKEAQKTLVNQQGVLAKSVEAMKQAQQGLVSAQAQLELAQKNVAQAEASLSPILKEREQLRLVQKDQYKEQARLQAVPTGIEKDYQPKLSALQTTLQEAKDALPPMVKAWESAKQKLAEASLPLEKQKAVWTESNKVWTELKQRLEAAEKAFAKAEKDIPQREQNLQEIAKNLATLEPQVEPLKLKVKEAEAKYLAMLPATPARAQ
jgi:chromosome segregation ATPase